MVPGFRLTSLLRRRPKSARVDRVAPWLFVGPALDAAGYRDLRDRGVTHVVDLREEDADDPGLMASLGLKWLRLPIPDRKAPAPGQLDELRSWLAVDSGEGDPVLYIHCHAGLGRTPTVAIALLMHHDMPLRDAHRHVRAARPGAQPTASQDAYLEDLARRIQWRGTR
ncbi:MAG: hypothetical protein EPO65_13285 [Dehalococcoidia bacterium]|nr:MAG: hypothetical protein EPO65_13285 [Dehalococcoidia bacterium]